MQQPHSNPETSEAGGQFAAASPADDEYRLLTTEDGRRLVDEAAGLRTIGPAELERLRKMAGSTEMAATAVRLAHAQHKAADKFARGARMWVEPVGVEQATAEPVARYKAGRFHASPVVVDLCSGIGGDAIALAAHVPVIAVDSDAAMCRRVRWNAGVYEVADSVLAVRARAEAFPLPPEARVHLDPDRRAHGGRGERPARALEDYAPGPEFWTSLIHRAPGGAIKLSPAADLARHFPQSTGPAIEIDVISLRGECKEATVWFGELAECRRRATRLPEHAVWTDRDGFDPEPPGVAPPDGWIFDPDPSLIRAGLLDGFARMHRLCRAAEGVDYLTGPEWIDSAFLSAFAVIEVSPLDRRHLRRMLQRHRVGTLEIKVRGLDLTPETLRARLKPRGDQSATLIIVGGPGPARALLARRLAPSEIETRSNKN